MGDLAGQGWGMAAVRGAGRQPAGSCLSRSGGCLAVASQLALPWPVGLHTIGTGVGMGAGGDGGCGAHSP